MGGDTNADLLRGVYAGFSDPTSHTPPRFKNAEGQDVGMRTISQAQYDALIAAGTAQADVVYVITDPA